MAASAFLSRYSRFATLFSRVCIWLWRYSIDWLESIVNLHDWTGFYSLEANSILIILEPTTGQRTKFDFWHFGQSIWRVTSIGEKFGSTVPVTTTLFPQCLHVNSLVIGAHPHGVLFFLGLKFSISVAGMIRIESGTPNRSMVYAQ
jgi:hypothetical protein